MPTGSKVQVNGFACKQCRGTESTVLSTRRGVGCKIRVRRCDDCGHHFRTRETVESVACPAPRKVSRAA